MPDSIIKHIDIIGKSNKLNPGLMFVDRNNNNYFNDDTADKRTEIIKIIGVKIAGMPNDKHKDDADNKSENYPNKINIIEPPDPEAPITIDIDDAEDKIPGVT